MMAGFAVLYVLCGFVLAAMAGAHIQAETPLQLRIGSAGSWGLAALALLVLALLCAFDAGVAA